jgi:hypothetical protein
MKADLTHTKVTVEVKRQGAGCAICIQERKIRIVRYSDLIHFSHPTATDHKPDP